MCILLYPSDVGYRMVVHSRAGIERELASRAQRVEIVWTNGENG